MDGKDVSSDHVIAELVSMGFDFPDITAAIKAVGPSLDNAIEFILNDSRKNNRSASTCSASHKSSGSASTYSASLTNNKVLGKRATSSLQSSRRMRQQNIMEHLDSTSRPERSNPRVSSNKTVAKTNSLTGQVEAPGVSEIMKNGSSHCPKTSMEPSNSKDEEVPGFDWENKVKTLLHKHFGFSSLKDFQKEVIAAWLSNQDCLVLAATGAGKSLCFQVPALLSGKVVVVISPLISLMHDQCLKLGKHRISACFLGSGQIDKSVEKKALNGAYNIIYVCPETILRLIRPLQSLAESRGIALFAIDEVHCVSKWGHDFRPDYRRLSMLRENFSAENLKFLKFDIPMMALTATATIHVRQDIIKSLSMSTGTKIVITSFFRPNLRFSVKHSRTSASSSYMKDFSKLIGLYTEKNKSVKNLFSQDFKNSLKGSSSTSSGATFGLGNVYRTEANTTDDYDLSDEDDSSEENDVGSLTEDGSASPDEKQLSVRFLEDDVDQLQEANDLDVSCGAFCGESTLYFSANGTADSENLLVEAKEKPPLCEGPLKDGPTIIYVPTRKETVRLAEFFSRSGVKAAAYNAKLPKSHLRQVHKEFHEDVLQVVVATIAFGMGIDKSNVRRIIHYGWPQSLEAYYQEAGRAGRDGELADCVLYANLSRIPTLLPSRRSEEQTKQANKMLSDCFRYGMKNSLCRAKILVEYFGEEFTQEKCLLCDVCINGPPEIQNLKAEANTLLQLISTHNGHKSCQDVLYDDRAIIGLKHKALKEKANIRTFVSRIREQNHTLVATDVVWWRGLVRILEDKGFIREEDDTMRAQIQIPGITDSGLQFLKSEMEQPFHVYPEADMLLSMTCSKPYSSFSEWGKGWADPEIRRQRLERKTTSKRSTKRKRRKSRCDPSTVRGRLSAKLSK